MEDLIKIVVGVLGGAAVTAIGFLYKERVAGKKESASRRREADIATFKVMRQKLPEATIKSLYYIEPYSGFPKSVFHEFSALLEEFGARQTIFHDATLNTIARAGVAAIQKFNIEGLALCVSVGNNFATCPPMADYTQKPQFVEEAKQVYQLGLAVHEKFLELHEAARVRLEI